MEMEMKTSHHNDEYEDEGVVYCINRNKRNIERGET